MCPYGVWGYGFGASRRAAAVSSSWNKLVPPRRLTVFACVGGEGVFSIKNAADMKAMLGPCSMFSTFVEASTTFTGSAYMPTLTKRFSIPSTPTMGG